jgi:hypothetical protein
MQEVKETYEAEEVKKSMNPGGPALPSERGRE